jgi:hypothetical protein
MALLALLAGVTQNAAYSVPRDDMSLRMKGEASNPLPPVIV